MSTRRSPKGGDDRDDRDEIIQITADEWVRDVFNKVPRDLKSPEEAAGFCGRAFGPMFFDVGQGICYPIGGWGD